MSPMSNGMISASSINSRPNLMPNCKVLSKASPEHLNWMIHVKYIRKEFDLCKKLAEDELKRSNGYSEYANYILGKIHQDNGEIQSSLKYFKKCAVINPQNIENLKQTGRCLFLLGRYQLALEMFFKAEKFCEIPDWNIYHHLGICYVKLKNEDKAKEYLKRAVQLGKNEKSFLELATLYESRLDYVNAIDVYSTALKLFPASTELSVNLGLVYMKIEDYKKAFNQLGCAIAHDPTNADALFTFAAEIQRHGEYDVAILKYKVAAHQLPECAEMWNNIGMCFFGKRKYVAAITCLKRAYYLNPTNWLTTYNLGLLHLNTRQHASAAIFLSTTVKLNSHHGPTYTLLALSLKHLGDVSNCKRCFEEALKRNKDDIEACVNYALFLFSLNEKTQAVKHHSNFLHLLNVLPNIDKELIHMGNTLTEALKNDQIEDIKEPEEPEPEQEQQKEKENSTPPNEEASTSTKTPDNPTNTATENEFDTDEELV
ncbi:Bardet-Biedl syndrome 4 protein [Planococcus citri]|uniref:Bardet-Biedl syndrome 4 protein n=1 Tax=Planococcus citri TaxID=170843 RepID=UPI0031F82847